MSPAFFEPLHLLERGVSSAFFLKVIQTRLCICLLKAPDMVPDQNMLGVQGICQSVRPQTFTNPVLTFANRN